MGVLVGLAVLAVLAAGVVLLLRRDALDLSPRGLLRGYLYVASLAGVITLAIGIASLANWGLATAFGNDLIHGTSARPAAPRCPPGALGCADRPPEELERADRQQQQERERRRTEDLLRGITSASFGALFWGAHWAARRGVLGTDERGSGLRRAYLIVGTAVFGIATIALVPTGVYQLLAHVVLRTSEEVYRPGADALGGAIAVLPIWLLYLRLIVAEFRDAPVHA